MWTGELCDYSTEPRNHPAWSLPESEQTSSTKLPLFINSFPLTAHKDAAKVTVIR